MTGPGVRGSAMFRTLLMGPDCAAFLALVAEFARYECHGPLSQGPGARGDGGLRGLSALSDAESEVVQEVCRRGLALAETTGPRDLLRGAGRGWLRKFVRHTVQYRVR